MITRTLKRIAMQISDANVFGHVVRGLENRSRSRSRLRVLAYHRIDVHLHRSDPYYPGLISASPAQFATQMDFLADQYHICSMDEVVAASKGGSSLPADSVLLTFDDATIDFAAYAWPVLKSRGLSATVFVPTAYPDDPSICFWWDQLYRAVVLSPDETTIPVQTGAVTLRTAKQRQQLFRRLKEHLKTIPHSQHQRLMSDIVKAGGVADPPHNNVLSWNALRQLDREGVTLAPHTHNHPMLNQLSDDDIRHELMTSCDVLQAQIGHGISRTLAYPAGGVSDPVISAMVDEGFDLAFSTQRGVNDQSFENPFRLRRINVNAGTTLGLLRIQLANWGN